MHTSKQQDTRTCPCGTEDDDKMVQCKQCKGWLHYRCTKLPTYQLYLFCNSNRAYKCAACVQADSAEPMQSFVAELNYLKDHGNEENAEPQCHTPEPVSTCTQTEIVVAAVSTALAAVQTESRKLATTGTQAGCDNLVNHTDRSTDQPKVTAAETGQASPPPEQKAGPPPVTSSQSETTERQELTKLINNLEVAVVKVIKDCQEDKLKALTDHHNMSLQLKDQEHQRALSELQKHIGEADLHSQKQQNEIEDLRQKLQEEVQTTAEVAPLMNSILIQERDEKITQQKKHITDLEKSRASLKEKIQQLTEKAENHDPVIQELQTSLSNAKEELCVTDAEKQDLQNQIKSLQEIVNIKEDEILSLKAHISSFDSTGEYTTVGRKRNQSVTASKPVYFSGEDKSLSNWFPCDIKIYGRSFKSSEHAYFYRMAQETKKFDLAEDIRNAENARAAKKLGHGLSKQVGEPAQIKFMEEILEKKKEQCERFRLDLEQTGTQDIREDTKDATWGMGTDGRGRNLLGKMLIKLRDNKKTNLANSTLTPHTKPKVIVIGNSLTKNLNPKVFSHYATVQRTPAMTLEEAKGEVEKLPEDTRCAAIQLITNDLSDKTETQLCTDLSELAINCRKKVASVVVSLAPPRKDDPSLFHKANIVNAMLEAKLSNEPGISTCRHGDLQPTDDKHPPDGFFSHDGFHLSRSGEKIYFRSLKQAIDKAIGKPPRRYDHRGPQNRLPNRHSYYQGQRPWRPQNYQARDFTPPQPNTQRWTHPQSPAGWTQGQNNYYYR